uniref:Ig-like domain-containing protein n=1 Tax=Chrysemys picta bellii TaxID=8478 RepID=A0A8C3HYB7_CHRPI
PSLGTTYSKPSISLHPSREVTPGEAVTVRCQAPYQNMRFLLYKDGNRTALQEVELAGNVAEFPIRNVSRRDAGSYHCRYSNKTDASASSHPSDPVELVVAGEGPGSVSPLPVGPSGGLYSDMEFFLHKAGHPNLQVRTVPDGTVAEFPIASVGREDRGSYTCEYRSIADQSRSSHPSDPVKIIVGGEGGARLSARLPAPHPARSPWGLCTDGMLRARLGKGRHFPSVDSDGFEVVFPISNVSREDGGSYSCSYHSGSEPFAVSYPSNPVKVLVRGEGPGSASPFPAQPPARPSRELGANGTLRHLPSLHTRCLEVPLPSPSSSGFPSVCPPTLPPRPGALVSPLHFSIRPSQTITWGESPSTPGSQTPTLTTRPHSPPRARVTTQES